MALELEPIQEEVDEENDGADNKAYFSSVDRREKIRREGKERRAQMRFEDGKEGRRGRKDRRKRRGNDWSDDRWD